MDPQSVAFTPRDDYWRLHSDMLRVQQTQTEHSDRLQRLERRQDDDARMKSVWGTSSPFPGVLSGTPQQGPVIQPPADAFSGFDDPSANLIGSLHLDADDEPRRIGSTSRANSVRFDETANQGHWSHTSRSSIDLIPRAGSSLSAHPMIERTYSHKSDGRQSSAGHSVHSAASGRANSLGIDTPFSAMGQSPLNTPSLAPGLSFLGPVPSIIRCWLTEEWKHDTMLYAAVCSGSYRSFLDQRLIDQLGLLDQVREGESDVKTIKIPIFLPEAVVRSASSRSNSPTPGLPRVPTLTVDFTVTPATTPGDDDRSVQIFIGCDVLHAHNADILFTSGRISLFDDDHSKISIPMVRPEDDRTFKSLYLTSSRLPPAMTSAGYMERLGEPMLQGLQQSERKELVRTLSEGNVSRSINDPQQPSDQLAEDVAVPEPASANRRHSSDQRPPLSSINTSSESKPAGDGTLVSGLPRSGVSPSIWGSWRRDGSDKPGPAADWSKAGSNYQRREHGIKVLRPIKLTSRTVSGNQVNSPSPSGTGQSRFFDDGKRRSSMDGTDKRSSSADKAAATAAPAAPPKENATTTTAAAAAAAAASKPPRSSNPVGSASAFSWIK